MKHVLEIVKSKVEKCERDGRIFILPSFDDISLVVKHEEIEPTGSIITGDEWLLSKGQEWLKIIYESKEKSRTFQDRPDKSYVTIEGKVLDNNGLLNDVKYSNSWEETSYIS